MSNGEIQMNVNEAVALANRIESLIRRIETFGKSKSDILEELVDMANDLRDYADRIDLAMYNELRADADAYNARRDALVGV